MQIRIRISGFGVGFGKTGLGVNVVSSCYIDIRPNSGGASHRIYGVTDSLSLGSDTSTFIAGHVTSNWMNIVKDESLKLLEHTNLVGKTADIEIKGTTVVSGKADVTMKLIDANGNAETAIEKLDIKVSGFQFASTTIRGKLKAITTKHQLQAATAGKS